MASLFRFRARCLVFHIEENARMLKHFPELKVGDVVLIWTTILRFRGDRTSVYFEVEGNTEQLVDVNIKDIHKYLKGVYLKDLEGDEDL